MRLSVHDQRLPAATATVPMTRQQLWQNLAIRGLLAALDPAKYAPLQPVIDRYMQRALGSGQQ